jgi:hypothetical protein
MQVLLNLDALCSLASPQSNGLSVLLQLGDELITLFDNIIVLLILVIWSICFNYAFACNTVNCTWDTVCCNELGKITSKDYVS